MNKITVTDKEMKNPHATIYSLKMLRHQLRINNRKLKEEIESLRNDADIDLLGSLIGDANIKAKDEAIKRANGEIERYKRLYNELKDPVEPKIKPTLTKRLANWLMGKNWSDK